MVRLASFLLLSCLAIFIPSPGQSQVLTKDLLPGLIITKQSTYDGTSLYGYINGGSSLYFEYGFDKLTVQEVVLRNEKFTIGYYRMKSSEAAFGIYSINTFQCEQSDQNEMISCQNPYQLQLFRGHHYISVVNDSGSAVARDLSVELMKKLKAIIPEEEKIELPDQLATTDGKLTGKVKFIKGELGLQNGLADWSSYFEGLNGFNLWIRQSQNDGKDIRKAVITFNNAAGLQTFIQNASLVPDGEGWKSALQQSERWSVKKIGEAEIVAEVQ